VSSALWAVVVLVCFDILLTYLLTYLLALFGIVIFGSLYWHNSV